MKATHANQSCQPRKWSKRAKSKTIGESTSDARTERNEKTKGHEREDGRAKEVNRLERVARCEMNSGKSASVDANAKQSAR